jgi:hypothetical protein
MLWLASMPGANATEPIAVGHEFHITEGGGFAQKTIKEMGSKEFQAMVTAACALYGVDCSDAASTIRDGAQYITKVTGNASSSVYITGEVTRHDAGSEAWAGFFRTPQGYQICNAALDYGNMSITGPSTFNTTIYRGHDNGLGFYAVVPKNRPTRQWIDAHFVIKYVPAGSVAQNSCMADGVHPWLCKGQSCNPLTRI